MSLLWSATATSSTMNLLTRQFCRLSTITTSTGSPSCCTTQQSKTTSCCSMLLRSYSSTHTKDSIIRTCNNTLWSTLNSSQTTTTTTTTTTGPPIANRSLVSYHSSILNDRTTFSVTNSSNSFPSISINTITTTRYFATNRDKAKKQKKKIKPGSRNKKPTAKANVGDATGTGTNNNTKKEEEIASLQHLEWVSFQRTISVDGFETGQTTQVQSMNRNTRGGKSKRKIKLSLAEQKIAERQRLTEGGGGQYPPVRYSDEETERLLNLAYSLIPERAGRRGTRNLKRQKRRWALVRTIHRTYKQHLANYQVRKMEKRSRKVKQVLAIKQEAPIVQYRDRVYQAKIIRQWYATMNSHENQVQQQQTIKS